MSLAQQPSPPKFGSTGAPFNGATRPDLRDALRRPAVVVLVALLVAVAIARLPLLVAARAAPSPWLLLGTLVGLGLWCRTRQGALVALTAAAVLNTLERDVKPQATLDVLCLDEVVEAHGELVEGWRHEQGSSTSLLRLESIGRLGAAPLAARGAELRVVVRGDLSAAVAGDGPGLARGLQLRLVGRCLPGARWYNRPEVASSRRLVVPSWQLIEEEGPATSGAAQLARWRQRVLRELAVDAPATSLGPPLARGLVLGQREQIPLEVTLGMRRFGLGHLLAISGLHVGLVAAIAALAASAGRPRVRLAIVVAAVLAYGFVAGPSPSVLRSVGMVLVAASSLVLSRQPRSLDALCWALVALLVVDPGVVRSLAFQLTGAATAGILLLAVPLGLRWWEAGRPWSYLVPLTVPIAAQIATLPWALGVFCRLHPAAPLLDLVAVAWLSVFLVVAGAWVLVGVVSPAWAGVMQPLLDLIAFPCSWLLGLPPAWWQSVPWWTPWPAALLATGLFSATVLVRRCVPTLVLVVLGVMTVVLAAPSAPDSAELVMLDVGQGDALLLRDQGAVALIDGGGWPQAGFGQKVLAPALAGLGVRRLDLVVATHGDSDHCGGLVDLTSEWRVARALVPAADLVPRAALVPAEVSPEPCITNLAEQVSEVIGARVGDRFTLGRLTLVVLAPDPAAAWATGNDGSLVIQVEGLGRRFLLAGDIERRGELGLVLDAPDHSLRSDLLKVAHHGSRSSSTRVLLEAVGPRLALISAGRRNQHGHPAREVLDRLEVGNRQILRTDLQGQIRVQWDEQRWWVSSQGAGP